MSSAEVVVSLGCLVVRFAIGIVLDTRHDLMFGTLQNATTGDFPIRYSVMRWSAASSTYVAQRSPARGGPLFSCALEVVL